MKFKQIATGIYSYIKKGYDSTQPEFSHALYGLTEEGEVYKYDVKKNAFVKLEETNINKEKYENKIQEEPRFPFYKNRRW